MYWRQLILVFAFCASSTMVLAGAWGVTAFESDDALDWVWELEESSGLELLNNAVNDVLQAESYIEAPAGAYAIAAAEVIAALAGKPSGELPAEVSAWVERQEAKPNARLVGNARKAVNSVLNENTSELAQLFAESEELNSEWRNYIKGLLQRLQ